MSVLRAIEQQRLKKGDKSSTAFMCTTIDSEMFGNNSEELRKFQEKNVNKP